jgi:hypothetical protein
MKAEINTRGVLHVIPENETEAYAIAKWAAASRITLEQDDPKRLQRIGESHWRDDCVKLNINWPPRLGDRT